MNSKNGEKDNIFIVIFDVLFIMILCFVTLLTAMFLQGEVRVNYVMNIKTFMATLISFIVYLFFMVSQSEKGLKVVIKKTMWKNSNN